MTLTEGGMRVYAIWDERERNMIWGGNEEILQIYSKLRGSTSPLPLSTREGEKRDGRGLHLTPDPSPQERGARR